MPPHGYIIVFSGYLDVLKKRHIVRTVRGGAKERGGCLSNNRLKSTVVTYSFPILLSLKCYSTYWLLA